MSDTDLLDLVPSLGQPRVLVVGDLMLDRYIWGDADQSRQEAAIILHNAERREERLGGAAAVASMLCTLGARVALAGVVGADAEGTRIRQMLLDLGVDTEAVLVDPERPPTVQERYIGRAPARHPRQLIRVDYDIQAPLSAPLQIQLSDILKRHLERADIVLVSDSDKGVCTPSLLAYLIAAAQAHGLRTLIDPMRGQDYRKYHGCSVLMPARAEAGLAAGRRLTDTSSTLDAAAQLREQLDLEAIVVTLDREGMGLVHEDGRCQLFPTLHRQVHDISGASDMVLSMLAMALAADMDFDAAINLANSAAGLEIEKIGIGPVTRDEILHDLFKSRTRHFDAAIGLEKVRDRTALANELTERRRLGQRVAFTNGCFDVLHAGHVQYLREARAQAHLLVLGLNSDASVRALKGPQRPVNCVEARALVLTALEAVDYLTIFDESTPLALIEALRPDVLVKGADYHRNQVVGADEVESWGGRVHLADLRLGYSTTAVLSRLQAA